MKFIVERKTWFRGKGAEESRLLRNDGTRCCIGFVGKQCGVTDEEMLNRSVIKRVSEPGLKGFPEWMYEMRKIDDAYTWNDTTDYTDQEREARLIAVFAKHGDEIEFV